MSSESESAVFERLIGGTGASLLFSFILGLAGASPSEEEESESRAESRGDRLYMFDPRNRLMMIFESPEDLEDVMRAMPDGKDGPSPASRASIEAMPTVAVANGGRECAICLEDLLVGGEAKEMPCRHVFHGICIGKWLGMHGSCPLCRYQMPVEKEEEKLKGEEGGAGAEDRQRREISVRIILNHGHRRGRGTPSDPTDPSNPVFATEGHSTVPDPEPDAGDGSSAPGGVEC